MPVPCRQILPACAFPASHQEGQRGLRALIFVGSVGMQAVAATAGGRIIESNLKIVVSQEPIEGRPCLFAPAALSRNAISLQACGDGRAGFHRLLVKAGLFCILGIEAVRSDRHKMTLHFTALNRPSASQALRVPPKPSLVCRCAHLPG